MHEEGPLLSCSEWREAGNCEGAGCGCARAVGSVNKASDYSDDPTAVLAKENGEQNAERPPQWKILSIEFDSIWWHLIILVTAKQWYKEEYETECVTALQTPAQ